METDPGREKLCRLSYLDVLEVKNWVENLVWGEMRNDQYKEFCADTLNNGFGRPIGVSGCHGQGGNQLFRLNIEGEWSTNEHCFVSEGSSIVARCEKSFEDMFDRNFSSLYFRIDIVYKWVDGFQKANGCMIMKHDKFVQIE